MPKGHLSWCTGSPSPLGSHQHFKYLHTNLPTADGVMASNDSSKSPLIEDTSMEPYTDPLQKLADIELLPDLFALMQSLENGEIQAKDFDNNAGAIRLKVSNIWLYLHEVDGICETVEEREKKIASIRHCNSEKIAFLKLFQEQVVKRLSKEDTA